MTRTYALKRLLEHGPLTTAEIVEIMGGEQSTVHKAIENCTASGVIVRLAAKRGHVRNHGGGTAYAWKNVYAVAP